MLRPRPMTRVLIVASKEHLRKVIQELYSHCIFHIRDFIEGEEEETLIIGRPLEEASAASEKLVKVRSLESTFQVKGDELEPKMGKIAKRDLREAIDHDLVSLEGEVNGALSRISKVDSTLREIEQHIKELTPFALAPLPLEIYRGYDTLAVITGSIPQDISIPLPHEKFYAASKEGHFFAVFIRREDRDEVEKLLDSHQFTPLPVPSGEGLPVTLLEQAKRRMEDLQQESLQIQKHLQQLREDKKEFIAACEELLTSDVEQAEAPLRFAVTEHAFLAEGWVPTEEVDRLKSGVSVACGGKALVKELPMDEHRLPPVEYDNPPYSRSTQLLMDTYSRPRYDELDPTLVVSIIFPIFFGIILGDVGYGLLLLGVSLLLRRFITGTDGRYLLSIMRNSSISSIFFGVLFSEFLGFEIKFGNFVLHPILFNRHLSFGGEGEGAVPDIPGLLIFSVWIGIFQITLGRILSSVNHYRHHGIRGAIPQLGWVAGMWGILFMIWSYFPMPLMPDFTTLPKVISVLPLPGVIGGVLLLLGLAAVATESALELIELPTMISHTMSYARLLAVGLSSVAIAIVINFIAIGMLIEPQLEALSLVGIVMIIIGILVFIGGHLGNTALGMVGGGLQSLRLQYVEFFTKFYKGGGVKYNPFGLIKRFTED